MRGLGERGDVGARAEDRCPWLERITTARTSGVLETQALERVGKLDIDAQVVGIELELGAGEEAAGRVDI